MWCGQFIGFRMYCSPSSIVIGENIYHHHERGKTFLAAAIAGARELAGPVTFSILTNIATFAPLYFIPGMMGKVFKFIPVVVITVFIISLFESIFVLPAHLGHGRKPLDAPPGNRVSATWRRIRSACCSPNS